MAAISRIIDKDSDTDFPTELRNLMGLETEDLTDAVIISDILLGMAERQIMKKFVPNWIDILNGSDSIAIEALRSCVALRICLNILDNPMVQNYYINDFSFVDIVAKSGINVQELRDGLTKQFLEQLSFVGVVRSEAWPEMKLVGKSTTFNMYDYYVDSNGNTQESGS